MALRGDGTSPLRLVMECLLGFLGTFVTVTVAGLLLLLFTARSFVSATVVLFMRDQVTRMAGVQLWVVITTLLLVVRFILDLFGPWGANRSMARVVTTIGMLNYSLVHYTLGLMQLSAARPSDYFQVWAVLLVTLQYSVKIGRPYYRSKQIPLLDIMSSFWTANLLRVQTFILLRTPLWLIWALNAARIISYFSSIDKADGMNQESNRFVADYMSYEHELSGSTPLQEEEFTMEKYNYLVLGEEQVLNDIREGCLTPPEETKQEILKRRRRVFRLDPSKHKELITVGKIWHHADGGLLHDTADGQANRLKDACLSFALYKLLRRRFYHIPLHEARMRKPWEKIRRLVFKYILQDEERAFRIISLELSFLQDLFYGKHAAMFANGFPIVNMVLSLSLLAAVGYIAYPVRYIPERMDPADRNKITHGVLITRVIIFLIAVKELAEIYLYVFSQWTKVLMLCSYVRHGCMRHWLVQMAMRAALCLMNRGLWDERIRQHNLLISTRGIKIGGCTLSFLSKFPKGIKLEVCTKKAIFNSLQELGPKLTELEDKELARLDLFIPSACSLPSQFKWALEFEAVAHKIVVWHIATCLCEIKLASGRAKKLRPFSLPPRPFIPKPERGKPEQGLPTATEQHSTNKLWEDYMTAASLSNYCMYLVTEALVPDNGIVARKVFLEVRSEINRITLDGRSIRGLFRRRSMQDMLDRLNDQLADWLARENQRTADEGMFDDVEAPMAKKSPEQGAQSLEAHNSIFLTMQGARLAKELMDELGTERAGRLWEQLAHFWAGLLLYLAVFTRASRHRAHLAGRRELTTHLWALLSHAGAVGGPAHGHTFLDAEELETIDPLS